MSQELPSTNPPWPTIGILGGIASGKSAVARALAGPSGTVLAADHYAQEALDSPAVVAEIKARFGPELLDGEGRPDRKVLADMVFRDPETRRLLESWIHPLVRERICHGLTEARAQGRGPIVLDVPLLLENDAQHGLVSECDFLVFVSSEAEAREVRAMARHGWKPGEVARREKFQRPLTEKRALARHVIENRGSLEELQSAVDDLLMREGINLA